MKTAGPIAKKIGMTRMVEADGHLTAVTLRQAEAQKATKTLSAERDGYNGFQVGYFAKPERKLAKPDVARLRKANVQDNYTRFKEFRLDAAPAADALALGQPIEMTKFLEGVTAV